MKDIERFINESIKDFDRIIKYAKTAEIVSDRCHYATQSITATYDRAFGALLFMKCWANGLTENEYNKLSDKLISAKFKALDAAWETL